MRSVAPLNQFCRTQSSNCFHPQRTWCKKVKVSYEVMDFLLIEIFIDTNHAKYSTLILMENSSRLPRLIGTSGIKSSPNLPILLLMETHSFHYDFLSSSFASRPMKTRLMRRVRAADVSAEEKNGCNVLVRRSRCFRKSEINYSSFSG